MSAAESERRHWRHLIHQAHHLGSAAPAPPGSAFDARTLRNVAGLHPHAQPVFMDFLKACNVTLALSGTNVQLISGTRTYAEQDELYAQGRTRPGPVVTKARGGYSNHNFGIAGDVGIFRGGKYIDDLAERGFMRHSECDDLYRSLGTIGERHGLTWGGRWKSFPDDPHFQLRPKWSERMSESDLLAGLRSRHDSGRDVFA